MKLSKVLLFAVTGCLLLSMSVFATELDIYGKIAGRILDGSTNQPLIGVNVIVKGTTLGAATNQDGRYTILQVPPGIYEVELAYIGYKTTTIQDVQVQVNLTTTINFNMEETVLDVGEEVVVVAERPLVILDQTSSSTKVTGEEIEDIPQVSSAQDILQTMPGVVGDGESLSIRGGRTGEVLYLINGMPVQDPLFRNQTINVNKYAISEVELQTGGFNAEYGDVMSGVVNIVTRRGGARWNGRIGYFTDKFGDGRYQSEQDPFAIQSINYGPGNDGNDIILARPAEDWYNPTGSSLNKFSQNTKRLEFSLGGPLPSLGMDFLNGKLDFFISGIFESKDGYLPRGNLKSVQRFLPASITAPGDINPLAFDEFDNVLGVYGFLPDGSGNPQFSEIDHVLSLPILGGLFDDGIFGWNWGGKANNDYNINATLNYTMTDAVRLNFGVLTNQFYNQRFSNTAKFNTNKNRLDFRTGTNYTAGLTHTLSNSSFYTINFGAFINFNESVAGLYNGNLYYPGFQNSLLGDGQGDNYSSGEGAPDFGSLNSLYGIGLNDDGQLVIMDDGFLNGFRKYHKPLTNSTNGTNASTIDGGSGGLGSQWNVNNTQTYTLKADYTNQMGPHNEVKIGVEGRYMELKRELIDGRNFVPSRNFENTNGPWPQHGTTRDFYTRWPNQGAIYLQDKIEYETLVINVGVRFDWYDAGDGAIIVETDTPVDRKTYFSPRLGVSHPINDRAVLYFFFGKFLQFPNFSRLFLQQNRFRVNQSQINTFGNPDLAAEETTEYEVGADYQLSDNLKIGVTGFFKDNFNLIDSELSGPAADPFFVLINRDYGTDRGFEFELVKRYSNFISGRFNYTLSWATGKSSTFTQGVDLGVGGFIPLKETFLNWDRRNVFNGDIRFEVPAGRGPSLFGKQLDRWGLSFRVIARSGRPYTPDTGLESEVENNSARRPWFHTLDVRFRKDFNVFGGMTGSYYIDAINVYNRRNVIRVDNRDGTVFGPDQVIASTRYNPNRWGAPLNVIMGFALRF